MTKAPRTKARRGDSFRDFEKRAENDRQWSQKKSLNIRIVGMCGTAASGDIGGAMCMCGARCQQESDGDPLLARLRRRRFAIHAGTLLNYPGSAELP